MPTLIFRLPRLGGNEAEARVLVWKKAPGEAFHQGDILLEVETDKAVVDVPAPADGTLLRQLIAADAVAGFDEALADIEVAEEAAAAYLVATGATEGATAPPTSPASPAAPAEAGSSAIRSGRVAASPAARATARATGIDLATLSGSGPGGRVVRADVLRSAGGNAAGISSRVGDMLGKDMRVSTRQGEVFVRRWGPTNGASGATTVLIHGLFGDVDTWAAVAASLADKGLPVLALDLPAHGRTSAVARTVDELTDVVSQVLATLAPGPKLLVGHSLGGAVAAQVAQRLQAGPHGASLHGLLLIAPAGLGSEINQGFVQGMQHAGTPALLRRELAKLAQRLPVFGDSLVAQLHQGLRQRAAPLADLVAGFAVHGVLQVDIRPALEDLHVRVAVLWGRQDQVLPWTHALNLSPRVALHLFAEAGHMPQWECASAVSDLIAVMADG